METTTVAMATLTTLATDVGTVGTWFWGIFSNLMNTVSSNALILWPIIFAIVAGAVGLGLKVVRKFGIKGRR